MYRTTDCKNIQAGTVGYGAAARPVKRVPRASGGVVRRSIGLVAAVFALGVAPHSEGLRAQSGCTDPLAVNYDPAARVYDGSCVYRDTTLRAESSQILPGVLHETSGLVRWDGYFWTHNDDRDTKLYAISHAGEILDTLRLADSGNRDWEAIDGTDDYLLLGDFGNNATGGRNDLHILRIDKAGLKAGFVRIDTLHFHYSDKPLLEPTPNGLSDYDCEAMVTLGDSVLLFSKQWLSQGTKVYGLPGVPGHHSARLLDSIEVKGMVTGAALHPSGDIVALCGYSRSGQPFIYLLYGYTGTRFSRGFTRKLYLDLFFHQIEAVEWFDDHRLILTNERSGNMPPILNPQSVHIVNLLGLLPGGTSGTKDHTARTQELTVYPTPCSVSCSVEVPVSLNGQKLRAVDMSGQVWLDTTAISGRMDIPTAHWPNGQYIVQIGSLIAQMIIYKN